MSDRARFIALAGLLLAGTVGTAQAATITLTPAAQTVVLGQPVVLTVQMDFTDVATVGGHFSVFYDSTRLDFVSFTFDAGLGDDSAFRRAPDDLPGVVEGIGFGDLSGLTGPSTVGQVAFSSLATGSVLLTLGNPTDGSLDPFYDLGSTAIAVSFGSANVEVVPLPAALWMLLGGLAVLPGAIRAPRRERSAR